MKEKIPFLLMANAESKVIS